MKKLSLVMIVKNEMKVLARCLESVRDIVDEMIIVDTGSSDGTKEIAYSFGAKVFDFDWEDDFSKARNYALEQSTGEWNLIMDADEYLSRGTKRNIQDFISQTAGIGRIKQVNKIKQDKQINYSSILISRLIPKGVYFEGRVHEQVVSDLPRINTPIEVLHDGYYETDKTDRNLRLLLLELEERPEDPYILYQTAKQYKLLGQYQNADGYFERCYERLSANASYRECVVIDYLYNMIVNKNLAKGLEIIGKEKTRFADYPDFHFICGLFYMELVFSDGEKYIRCFPEIEKEYQTCLQIGETDKYSTIAGTGSFLAAYNLGVYYESTGDKAKAQEYYARAALEGYEPAITRINNVG